MSEIKKAPGSQAQAQSEYQMIADISPEVNKRSDEELKAEISRLGTEDNIRAHVRRQAIMWATEASISAIQAEIARLQEFVKSCSIEASYRVYVKMWALKWTINEMG